MRLRRPTASEAVLGLLCLMYLITYVDRVNIATAASEIRRELTLSNTQPSKASDKGSSYQDNLGNNRLRQVAGREVGRRQKRWRALVPLDGRKEPRLGFFRLSKGR